MDELHVQPGACVEPNPGRFVGYAFLALAVCSVVGMVVAWSLGIVWLDLSILLYTWTGWGLLHNRRGRRALACFLCGLTIAGAIVGVYVLSRGGTQAIKMVIADRPIRVESAVFPLTFLTVLCLLGFVGLWALLHPRTRAAYQRQAALDRAIERGQFVCWNCGYDLRGNVSGVCPECGVENLRVESTPAGHSNPYVAEWQLQQKEDRSSRKD